MDVLLGRTSKRLYAISVDKGLLKKAANPQQAKSSFESAINKLNALSLKHLRPDNYIAAKKAMNAKNGAYFLMPALLAARI